MNPALFFLILLVSIAAFIAYRRNRVPDRSGLPEAKSGRPANGGEL